MNHFTFGNATHQHYETVSGGSCGSGAGAWKDSSLTLVAQPWSRVMCL